MRVRPVLLCGDNRLRDTENPQMRHIAPAVAAVYVIVLLTLLERERPVILLVCGFAMLVGTVTGAMYLLVPEFDEMLSLVRFGGSAATEWLLAT